MKEIMWMGYFIALYLVMHTLVILLLQSVGIQVSELSGMYYNLYITGISLAEGIILFPVAYLIHQHLRRK